MAGIDANTIAMLHMDGTNLSTTFTDDALTPNIWTAQGGAIISTLIKKFGTASGLFNSSTSSYIDCPDSVSFTFSSAFTIDSWVDFTIINAQCAFYDHGIDDAGGFVSIYFDTTLGAITTAVVILRVGGTYRLIFNCPFVPIAGTQYHFAVVRIDTGNTSSSWRIFINGVGQTLTKTFGNWNGSYPDPTGTVKIGYTPNFAFYSNANYDEFRISNIARWTSDFTPPTSAYSVDGSASLSYRTLTGIGI